MTPDERAAAMQRQQNELIDILTDGGRNPLAVYQPATPRDIQARYLGIPSVEFGGYPIVVISHGVQALLKKQGRFDPNRVNEILGTMEDLTIKNGHEDEDETDWLYEGEAYGQTIWLERTGIPAEGWSLYFPHER